VLLVSSRRCARRVEAATGPGGEVCPQPNLVFPKGGWESDETLLDAAVREAYEEAGVSGRLETPHVDMFSYESLKDRPDKGGHSRQRTVYVFVLHVTTEHSVWPEKDSRNRVWVPVSSVSGRLKHEWMRTVFDRLCAERNWG
jgi:8-oxo-dGTP pyrophosphatase MutT (NUDIX family)